MTFTAHQALVTGGTEVIGRAVVRRLARAGHAVIAIYPNDGSAREDAGREFADAHLHVEFEKVDLVKLAQVAALFERLAAIGRSPELLVNAGGLDEHAPRTFLSTVDLDAVLSASVRATFVTCQQALKAMTQRRFGRIVNLAAPVALQGDDGQTAVAAGRGGVIGLTRALARQVGPLGVTVNAVCTGAVLTEGTTPGSDQRLEALVRRTPLRRAATSDEIAGMVNMLCQDDAGYITGQCLSINGGLS
ncbi:MAG: SDR family NAD(P)-dependent oxidoreductase [Myxococcaceae bacterium]